jgi:DNA-binding response OmpR family regulator
VIDDDHAVLSLERLILTDSGHEVLMATNARTGIDLLRIYDVDLIIVDIMMPDLSGFQFANIIRNDPRLQHCPMAFLTAKGEEKDIIKAKSLGADFYILKPIARANFEQKVTSFFVKNPPKVYPEVRFPHHYPGEAKMYRSVEVTAVHELGVEVLMDEDVEVDQVIELSSRIFSEIQLEAPLLRVMSVRPHGDGTMKIVRLTFVKESVEHIRKLRDWISFANLRLKRAG